MNGTILQPTYLPWMGYFEMIDSSDIYLVFDHVQFVKKSWQQRNQIKTPNGVIWLTIPVERGSRETRICDVKISYDNENSLEKHWKTITFAYQKAPYFKDYRDVFDNIYSKKYTLLRDLNVDIIRAVCDILGIKTKIIFSSEINLNEENMGKEEKIINLCKRAGIKHLYDAKGAQDFLDESLFQKDGISITFQEFNHPIYEQLYGDFIPYLSVLDLLFNEGENSLAIIKSGKMISDA
ncbi:MAG: WbqC family protein [Candidatus Methanoperedens sp.]|nr:WbqC family protein [Candidatus Methanoperedens sp.]